VKTRIKVLIAGAAITAALVLGFLVVKGVEAISHWMSYESPTICVKSHDVDNSHWGYGLKMDGKFGFGWIIDIQNVCDKTAPNPKYKGNQ